MSSRHTRRKAAAKRLEAKLEGLAQAERSRRIAATVKANKSSPIERNYYPESLMGSLKSMSYRGHVGSNMKRYDRTGMDKK